MSAQFDFTPGFDLTSVVSATQAQLQQAIAQIAPLSNVGGIIYGAVAPDVANNARFTRYMWIDTSGGAPYVLKTWNGAAWVASTVGAGSVSTAAQIVDGVITLAKLSVAGGGAGKLIRVNAGNTAFEFINFSDLLSAGSVPFTAIETTGGAANYFLKRNNANTAYALEPFVASFIPVNSIGFTQLQNGAAAVNILKSNAASNAWAEVEHKLANMTANGGTAYQIARINSAATAPEWASPQAIQSVDSEYLTYTSNDNGVNPIPLDDTIPQVGEGTQIISLSITPKLATSFLLIEAILQLGSSAASHAVGSIFRDGAANAIVAAAMQLTAAAQMDTLMLRKIVASTAATLTTFTLRFGGDTGTIYTNGSSAARRFGGVSVCKLRVTEVIA